jgi:hypothetical protein
MVEAVVPTVIPENPFVVEPLKAEFWMRRSVI